MSPISSTADHDMSSDLVMVKGHELAEIATAVWRLERKVDANDDIPDHVRRHVRAVADTLAESGLRARSYDGSAFDLGLRMRVVAYQPMVGLEREVVIETVRPAVYLHGALVAMSEVIVGTPAVNESGEDREREEDDKR
jgi:hypothetical protein